MSPAGGSDSTLEEINSRRQEDETAPVFIEPKHRLQAKFLREQRRLLARTEKVETQSLLL